MSPRPDGFRNTSRPAAGRASPRVAAAQHHCPQRPNVLGKGYRQLEKEIDAAPSLSPESPAFVMEYKQLRPHFDEATI